uniref:G-protein coupled receptors family 1 profile domain-containing protein n=1 Tax=Ditylenchus dipsaci TaxID=166011 RepID=A0A915EB33_9BILA
MATAKLFPVSGLNISAGSSTIASFSFESMSNSSTYKNVSTIVSSSSSSRVPSNYAVDYADLAASDYMQMEEQSFVAMLYLSYMPICCFFGLTGNCMVWILIRSNRIFKKLPSKEGFMKEHSEQHSMVLCKCATFLAHFCDFASVWLIVCVGFERLTLLYRVSFRRSLVNAKRHVIFLLIASGVCNMWILFVAEINLYGGCDIKPQYEEVYNDCPLVECINIQVYSPRTFSLIETIICMIIPSAFIIISNFFVILKLRAHMKQIPTSPTVSFNTADTVYSTGPSHIIKSTKISKASLCRMGSRLSISRIELQEAAGRKRRHSLRYTDLQLTRSLLVVTTVFIALNLPNYLYRIGIQFFHINDQSELMQRLSFMAHVLLYTHHACLFYLYIFNSPQMRKRLAPTALKLLECYCFKPPMQDFSDHAGLY